ncbi:MAG TPA: phosphatase PAP2 family protein [Gemmatimonadaceae bacterium]|nr:phosphatase PAP2 family protein [Gemmatimonadaceae bacterium]
MPVASERRHEDRGRSRVVWDVLFRGLRTSYDHAQSFGSAVGMFLIFGALIAVLGTYAFAELAKLVSGGHTQAFDDAVLLWMQHHQTPWLEGLMLEITMLGTWIVVLSIVSIAGLFLWLTRHRYSAVLLLVATAGGIGLNNILKVGFTRPRPHVFEWGTTANSWSFPSGHAMSATVVYMTVAYLAARLQKRHVARLATLAIAAALVALICFSRLYLGVHYPSDVIAGVIIGLSWAAFCMATLEAIQRFAKRNAKEVLKHEAPAPKQATS